MTVVGRSIKTLRKPRYAKRQALKKPRIARRKPASGAIEVSLSKCPAGLDAAVRDAVTYSLSRHGKREGELSVAFVSTGEMRRLHARWLNDSSPTDVITFDLVDRSLRSRGRRTGRSRVDGQLVVCTSVAREEARRRDLSWRRELLLYVVHGCLHLCGYDDRKSREAARMAVEQNRILRQLSGRISGD